MLRRNEFKYSRKLLASNQQPLWKCITLQEDKEILCLNLNAKVHKRDMQPCYHYLRPPKGSFCCLVRFIPLSLLHAHPSMYSGFSRQCNLKKNNRDEKD